MPEAGDVPALFTQLASKMIRTSSMNLIQTMKTSQDCEKILEPTRPHPVWVRTTESCLNKSNLI